MAQPHASRTTVRRIVHAGDLLTGVAANLACAGLVCLALGIILGVVLRWVGVDNSATYDFTLFALVWVGFAGAVLTARLDFHVTSGISLERILTRGAGIVLAVRFIVLFVFLLMFAWSGWQDTLLSFQTGEATYDTAAWPVWIAKAAIPVGCLFWALVELVKYLQRLFVSPPQDG